MIQTKMELVSFKAAWFLSFCFKPDGLGRFVRVRTIQPFVQGRIRRGPALMGVIAASAKPHRYRLAGSPFVRAMSGL